MLGSGGGIISKQNLGFLEAKLAFGPQQMLHPDYNPAWPLCLTPVEVFLRLNLLTQHGLNLLPFKQWPNQNLGLSHSPIFHPAVILIHQNLNIPVSPSVLAKDCIHTVKDSGWKVVLESGPEDVIEIKFSGIRAKCAALPLTTCVWWTSNTPHQGLSFLICKVKIMISGPSYVGQ